MFVWGGCKFFKSGSLPDFLNVGIFAKILEFFLFFVLPQEGANLTKEDPFLNFKLFLCPKIHKIPNFSDLLCSQTAIWGTFFCRLGNLGGAMHPCTPPPNGHAFNMYWWYRIVHVQQTLNYTNLTTAPKCKKPNLNLFMCSGVGVWVLLKSPFCVKHPIFTSISWDFDDLSTKTRHAPYNVWSSEHPPAGCTLDGNVIVTDQKDTLLLRVASAFPSE